MALGSGYSAPQPILLHIIAPSYEPIDLEIAEAPIESQLGYDGDRHETRRGSAAR